MTDEAEHERPDGELEQERAAPEDEGGKAAEEEREVSMDIHPEPGTTAPLDDFTDDERRMGPLGDVRRPEADEPDGTEAAGEGSGA